MEFAKTTNAARGQPWALAGVIFAVVALVFFGARHGGFLFWDDDINIVTNPHLRDLTAENLRWMFTDASYMRRYVPLAWLNWSIDAAVFGLTPRSAHIGNILCHALNAVVVFLVIREVLAAWKRERPLSSGAITSCALFGALFWALHPLRVEVVAWASGRMYCQAGFFAFVALWTYLRAVRSAVQSRSRRGWMAVSVGAFAASLLTYPIALMFFAVLVVIDGFVLRRFHGGGTWRDSRNRPVWLEKLPFVAVAVLVAGVTVLARFRVQGFWDPPPTLAEFGLGARLMQAGYVWTYYVWRPLVPTGLAPVYTTLFEFNPMAPLFVGSAVALVTITGLLVWRRREWPAALAVWLAHLLLLTPMLGLTERPHYTNDRYSYLEGVLWSIAAAAALAGMRSVVARRVAMVAAGALIAACAVLSVNQVRVWRANEPFFRYLHARMKDDPYRADIAYRLGDLLRMEKRFDEAVPYYEESLRIAPNNTRAAVPHLGLGRIAQAAHRYQEAANHYQAAIAVNARFPDSFHAMGELLVEVDRPADAVMYLQRATALRPAKVETQELLGVALFRSGRNVESIEPFAAVVRLRPNSIDARFNLATALAQARRCDEAVASSEEAVKLAPASAEVRLKHGDVLRMCGRLPEAIAALREGVRMDPASAGGFHSLGTALALAGNFAEAVEAFRQATRLDPNLVQAHFNLGLALRDVGRRDEAVASFRTVLRLKPDYAAAGEEIARLTRR